MLGQAAYGLQILNNIWTTTKTLEEIQMRTINAFDFSLWTEAQVEPFCQMSVSKLGFEEVVNHHCSSQFSSPGLFFKSHRKPWVFHRSIDYAGSFQHCKGSGGDFLHSSPSVFISSASSHTLLHTYKHTTLDTYYPPKSSLNPHPAPSC